MSNILKPIGGSHPPHAIMQQRNFHKDVATEKQLSAAHKSSTAQLKDATKLGSILKKIGGGLSRHRP